MHYVGIDPGLKGAIALFDPLAKVIQTVDIPIVKGRKVKKKARSQTDYIALAEILQPYHVSSDKPADYTGLKVFMEHVWSMPNDGAIQGHNFGLNIGAIRGVLATYNVTPELVLPAKWKKHFDLIGKDKMAAVNKAVELFPVNDFFGIRGGVKDGRCEAALIAVYGYDIHHKTELQNTKKKE